MAGRERLTEAEIVAIREARAAGESLAAIAARFKREASYVSRIVRGEVCVQYGGPLAVRRARKRDGEWYVVDAATGCWVWQGRFNPGGYGIHATGYDEGYSQLAHRYFYEKYVGAIPTDFQIDHLCRNTKCVNPSHLEAVTARENTRRSSRSVLDENTARAVREIYSRGQTSQAQLAKMFGVTRASICNVVLNRAWYDPGYTPPAFGSGKRTDLAAKRASDG